jgi:hypothetical protein
MPRKNTKIEKTEEVQEVVISKPKRGRKSKKVEPVATAEPVEESVPAPVPKKRVRKKKVQEAPVVVEEVKVEEVKPKKKPKALKVEKSSDAKQKRAPSKWMLHVQEFRKKNEGMSYRDALKQAKQSYQK